MSPHRSRKHRNNRNQTKPPQPLLQPPRKRIPPRKAKRKPKRKPKRSPKKRPTPKNPKLRKNPKRLHRIHAARSETPRALPPRRIRRRKSPKPILHRPRAHALPREAPHRL